MYTDRATFEMGEIYLLVPGLHTLRVQGGTKFLFSPPSQADEAESFAVIIYSNNVTNYPGWKRGSRTTVNLLGAVDPHDILGLIFDSYQRRWRNGNIGSALVRLFVLLTINTCPSVVLSGASTVV